MDRKIINANHIVHTKKPKYGKTQFVENANIVHQNKYGYDKVEYINNHTNVVITCPDHGDFLQDPGTHLKGHGCPKCGAEKRSLKSGTNIFQEKGREIFGNKYDYSKCGYTNWDKLETIICPEHGEFTKSYKEHIVRKRGCKLCEGVMDDTPSFIYKARIVHNNKYNYDKSVYTGSAKDLIITCPIHGDFNMRPSNHITNKQGCAKCRNEKFSIDYRDDLESFIVKSVKKHGLFYDYSLVKYINNKTPVEIVCPVHGSFWCAPGNHYTHGTGCPKCGLIKISEYQKDTKESFIKKAAAKHGDRYNYDKSVYVDCNTEIEIVCSVHGSFFQKPMFHLRGCGCQSCAKTESRWEGELKNFIRDLGFVADKNKSLINPYELDIYVPDKNLAVETNGLFWHSEYNDSINERYHLNKTELCEKKGIELVHIFEDEWENTPEIVKSMIRNKLHQTKESIYARKCVIRSIEPAEANEFLENNHLQGKNNGSSIHLGLYQDRDLVSVMTFGSPRQDKSYDIELYKFCNKINTRVVGAASKLFKHFLANFPYRNVLTYANKRFSRGSLYQHLGFEYVGDTSAPNYWYIHKDHMKRFNRAEFQKHLLKDKLKVFDPELTEVANMHNNNYYRIWDCGSKKYKFSR